MRMETPLHVTPEESLGGLSAAMGGTEDSKVTQQPFDDVKRPVSNVVPPAVSETSPKVISERTSQEELPRRNEISRETSREDALATTRLFFNTVAERRNITEVLTMSTVSVSQIDTPLLLLFLLRQNLLSQILLLLECIYQVDHHLDPLPQLLVGLRHGYNVYQRDK